MDRAFLFDLDGTLLDLSVDIERVRIELSEMFAPLGYAEVFRPILPRIEEAAARVGRSDAEQAELRTAARALIDRAEVEAARVARACPGAAGAIELVAGARHGIVTDNCRACVQPALVAAGLDAVGWAPGDIVSRDDVENPKPDPEGVVRAASSLLPSGGELWLVGNSPRDVAAGVAARGELDSIELVIVGVGAGGLDGADRIITDLDGLAGLVRATVG